jgi:pyruvate formate lyase activating enzyme
MKKEAMLYKKLPASEVRCHLCSHYCRIKNHAFGFCRVRQNEDGTLYTRVYGVTAANHVDPVEKKPLYHFLPNTLVYSIGTVGCNFHCGFCQNWEISQAAEESSARKYWGLPMLPEKVVEQTAHYHCASIAYTYTEPTIFFEYVYDTSELARKKGIRNIFVTNGYMTEKALDTIASRIDAANVDLKSYRDEYYRNTCSGRLKPVLNTIRHMKELDIWVEITTLLIPGENDSQEEVRKIADFIAEVDVAMPWHISAFHPSYRFMEHRSTTTEMLLEARDIGLRAGLNFVYLGNVPIDNDTNCPTCGKTVIKRRGTLVGKIALDNGRCPDCRGTLPGVWS